jgi:hypothetical protein
LDLNNDGSSPPGGDDLVIFIYRSPTSQNETLVEGLQLPSWSPKINATQTVTTSPHSASPHRLYEVAMPLQPLLGYRQVGANGLPIIGADFAVADSYGNGLDLSSGGYGGVAYPVLEFGTQPVPENIEPLVPLALAVLLIGFFRSRRTVDD